VKPRMKPRMKRNEKGFVEVLLLLLIIVIVVSTVRSCSAFKSEEVLEYERIVELHDHYDIGQCKDYTHVISDQTISLTCTHAFHVMTSEKAGDKDTVNRSNLKQGRQRSCGCLRKQAEAERHITGGLAVPRTLDDDGTLVPVGATA